MTGEAWKDLCERLPSFARPHQLDAALAELVLLDHDERAALWLYAWSRGARNSPDPSPRGPIRTI